MLLTGKPLLVILGATAVGKTALSLALASALNGEIISADSRQVYRYMDIGTAKPTPEQRALVPHHLIDLVDPDQNLSAAQYQRLAYTAIDAVHSRGRLPLLVGGTGQYISAVIEGWTMPEIPPNPVLRAELEAFVDLHGLEALGARLRTLDPDSVQFIDFRNPRRVIRALEVCIETGQPFSAQRGKTPPSYRLRQIGLTMEREPLYVRADLRFDAMMREGFLDEVQRLLDMGYPRTLPSMSGLGYAQLAAHLLDGLPLDEAIAAGKQATHDFIRRQYTWFRKYNAEAAWFAPEQGKDALDLVRRWLEEDA
jgi:tRNA dimethylallyltransferase